MANNSLMKLRCSTGQGHTEVFQDGLHLEQASQGSIKEVESKKLASKNRRMSVASIALEVAEVEGQLVRAQTIHCNESVCMAVVPEGRLF